MRWLGLAILIVGLLLVCIGTIASINEMAAVGPPISVPFKSLLDSVSAKWMLGVGALAILVAAFLRAYDAARTMRFARVEHSQQSDRSVS